MESHANVYVVSHMHMAKYKVYIVEHEYQQRNAELIAGGTLAAHEHEANLKVCIVKHMNQADICITQANFPKPGRFKPPAWR